MVVLIGGLALTGIFGLQLLLWRFNRDAGDDEINEFVRDLGGKRAVLTLFEHEGTACVQTSIELPEEAPRLELARRGSRPILAKWVGALAEHALADPNLAERFVCRQPESPRAFEALARLKGALLESTLDVRELRLDRKKLGLVVANVKRADLDVVCELLDRLARAVMLGGAVSVREEDATKARCGFCHAQVDEEALTLVACERCSALVHEACWVEHGRCPVLGCKGATPRKLPAR
jgi:hypothetical protein